MEDFVVDNCMVNNMLSDIEFCIIRERSNKKRALAVASLNAYYRSYNFIIYEYLKTCGYDDEKSTDLALKYTDYYMRSKGYIL